MDGETVKRNSCWTLLRNLLLTGVLIGIGIGPLAASTESRGPSGCPPGVSPAEFVCFTIAEEAARQEKELDLEQALADTRLDLVLAQKRKRSGRLWSSVGVGYSLNEKTYDPYGYMGTSLGPVGIWGGFWGDSPSVGIGWQF